MKRCEHLVLLGLVIALAGCTSGRNAAPGAADAAEDGVPAARDVMELGDFRPLAPGAYYIDPDGRSGTPLDVRFNVDGRGWTGWIGAAKFWDDHHVAVSITTVQNVVRHGCRDHSRLDPPVGPSVDDLATALTNLRPFRVTSSPADVTVDGYSGKHLELTAPDLDVADCLGGDLKGWVSPLLGGAFYGYSGPGYAEEYWILDVEGTRLVIVAGRGPGMSAEDVEEMRAVVDSIQIEPEGATSVDGPSDGSDARPLPASCSDLLATAPEARSAPPFALTDGTVLTMDEDRRRARSVSVKNGKIVSTSDRTGRPIDLEGATVMPGFIDSHGHWIGDKDLIGRTAQQEIQTALSWGWTSISELFVSQERLNELCELELNGELRVKVGAFLPMNFGPERFGNWYDDYEPGEVFGPHLWLQGLKFFADRAEEGFGYQTDPPSPRVQGELFWKPERLGAAFRRATDAGWQIAIHATGDGGLDLALDAFSMVGREGIVEGRHRVEHLTTVRDDQVDRLRRLGLIGSIQLSFFHAGAVENVIEWVGRDRVELAGRWRDLIDAGIPITGSTDRPWAIAGRSGPSIPAIAEAVTRVSPTGKRPPRWMRAQRMTIDEALRSLTIDAAFAQGKEDSLGSVEPGKVADLVILSSDPTRVSHDRLWDISVVATIVDGAVEYCARSVPQDLRELCP